MASDLGDGDYLGAYRRFFVDFLDKVDPDDQLPIKTSGHDVTEGEIVGETVHMTLQYLNQQLCPPSLQCYIVQLVVEEIKATCRKEPETCGFRQEEKTYAPLKLMQAITSKVNEICLRYLENSRLALLPPPPSTPMPLATAFAIRNTRRKMEDRHVILHDLNAIFNIKDDSVASYYAVFDGHAGYQAAVYCSAHLHQYLAESRHYPTDPERALRDAFLTTDALFIQKSTRQTLSSGTTAVCALIMKKKLYVAWAGDSQAALSKRGVVSQLVNPHKPDRNDERERVEEMGGTVIHFGIWRVNGNLAVSRAIGDAQYKPYVTGDPEIRCITLDGQEDFLIIACDGLWDCVTENEAAALVYGELYRNLSDYNSVSQRLVEYAKGHGSIDNITVIVVFLTSPSTIASRPQYGNPLLADVQLDNMEPDNRFMSNTNGQYDVNSPFVKQSLEKDVSPDLMDDEDPYGGYGNKSNNGMRHENGGSVGVPVTDYDAEEDDEDLGPETDVDAVDDVSEPGPTLADVSRQLFPEKQDPCELYQADEGMDDDSSPSPHAKKTNQQALIPDADNVADSEDSEDEWNYYRIEPNKEKESAGAAGFSPAPKVDNDIVDNVGVTSSPSDHGDNQEVEKEQESSTKNDTDSSSESDSEREIRPNVLIDAEISPDNEFEVNPSAATTILTETEERDNREEPQEENKSQEEDMDFQLNPNAAEFVPVSPTPIVPTRTELDAPIAGSPLKQTALMDDIKIPSRREFQNEARHRPGEIEEKSCTNGQLLADLDDCPTDKPEATSRLNALDVSEISSTKAEFGDESSFMTTSDLHRTGTSNLDGSYTDSYNAFEDSSIDPMTASFGPADFMTLSNPVDLNAVHDLTDADLIAEENGEQGVIEEDTHNQLDIEKTPIPSESGYLYHSTVDALSDEQTGDIMNSSSPVSSPQPTDLHRDELDFGNEAEIRDHSVDASPSQKLAVDSVEEKYIIDSTIVDPEIEQPDTEQPMTPVLNEDINVTCKLLEMDLEDRGSQDCEFEKCNEKLRAESPAMSGEFTDLISTAPTSDEPADLISSSAVSGEPTELILPSATSDKAAETILPSATSDEAAKTISPSPTFDEAAKTFAPSPTFDEVAKTISPSPTIDELADTISSSVTKESFVESCAVPDSLPISSANIDESPIVTENLEKPEVEKLVESFNDLRTDDDLSSHTTAAPRVEVLHNPLDLNFESASPASHDNLVLDYSPSSDYIVAKVPESPGVAVSPLVEHPSSNPFAVVESNEVPASYTGEVCNTASAAIDAFGTFDEISQDAKPAEPRHIDDFGTFEDTAEKAKTEIEQVDDFATFEDMSQKEEAKIQETPSSTEEAVNVSTGLKLSESLQEFTGLEQQLNPEKVTNGLAFEDNLLDIHNGVSKEEDLVEKEIAKEIAPEVDEKCVEKEVDRVTSTKPIVTENEKIEKIDSEPESNIEKAAVVAAAAVATTAAAGTVAAVAAKATKAKPPTKTAQKSATATKAATNKSTPTSPTKAAGPASRTAVGPKKTATGIAAARPNKLETGTKSVPSTAVGAKSTAATKSTLGAPKPTGRLSASSPRGKLPSTSTSAKSATSTLADKKPTTNGEVTKSTATAASKGVSTTARAPSKTLVKSSTTSARAPLSSAASPKPRVSPATATTNKVASKTSTTGTVGTNTQRPKTAPAGGTTSLATKSRLASTGNSATTASKSLITEKQIKETANKQISSSRTSTTTTASKTSRSSVTSSTTTTSRRVGASKTTTTSTATSATVPPPIKRPPPISRPGAKTAPANAKASATKVTSTSTEKTKVVVQNGVCKAAQETKIVTSTTVTRTGDSNEEDVPKKDLSPVELPTDNQLIITAD